MLKRIDLHPDKVRYKNFSFSTCVVAGDFVFTSHQGGLVDDNGKWLTTIEEQTEQSFKNLERALAAAGATFDDVVKMMIYMKNADDFQAIEDIYNTKFKIKLGLHRPRGSRARYRLLAILSFISL